jgi:excisionase family DNA binding protein
MNLKEAARFLRVSPKRVERLVTEQGLPGRQIDSDWRFLRTAIERWLEPAKSHGSSVLDQFGVLADDPTYEEYRRLLEENRRRLNEEVA